MTWPQVPLSEFVRHRKASIQIEDDKTYRRVTVKLHAQGIVPRDEVSGSQIKTKKQFPVQANDLLVAEIDAKAGGYGIVPAGLAGAVVSSHYFLYEVDPTRCEVRFLEWWLKTPSPLDQLQQFIRGSLNYAAIRPYHFPTLTMPLPSLDEQRRILAVIDKLEQLRHWHRLIGQELILLEKAVLDRAFKGELSADVTVGEPRSRDHADRSGALASR
ncbi:MAG: restriction endonuclease subunit S [Planctomycetota bacterium]|nr:restriction endonuclease subunit S [Planctomycetota bacterium]